MRGDTEVIVSEHRPVPLWQHVMAGRRMYDLFEETTDHGGRGAGRREVNPDLVRLARQENQNTYNPRDRRRGKMVREADRERERRQRGRIWTPGRPEVIDRLDNKALLPAITFIFSRAGSRPPSSSACTPASGSTTRTTAGWSARSSRSGPPPSPARTCTSWATEWLEGLERGIAAHPRACSRPSRRSSRNCSSGGWSRRSSPRDVALGATWPRALGALEKLVKWNGEQHADITGEYTQLTGRAGRRGIDVEGHAVVLWQRGMDPTALAGLAGTRTYPLRSSFRPAYKMAVNLVEGVGGSARTAGGPRSPVPGGLVSRGDSRQVAAQRGGLAGSRRG
ncbi:DEAD/DEAH box helicase [Streptomyces californicus]